MAAKSAKTKTNSVAKSLGLPEAARSVSVDLLTNSLASTYMLMTKTRKFHWNVTGMHFAELHELFEEQYQLLAASVDEIAERIRQLGSLSIGTLSEMEKCSFLQEHPGVNPDDAGMVAELLADHENVIRHLREAIDVTDEKGDMGTADFLTALMEAHEKMAWFLRAHIEGGTHEE